MKKKKQEYEHHVVWLPQRELGKSGDCGDPAISLDSHHVLLVQ
jgi:hypothetical protein